MELSLSKRISGSEVGKGMGEGIQKNGMLVEVAVKEISLLIWNARM